MAPSVLAEHHHTGRAGVDAELVLQRRASDVIPAPERAVGVDQKLGHEEQRNAARPFGGIRQAGEHEMHDVLSHVVIAPGDENLLTMDSVPVSVRDGPGADCRQVRTGLGFGEVHRAGPLAADQAGQIDRLQCVRCVGLDRLHGARGEHGAQGKRHVGGIPHLRGGGCHDSGQPLTAVFGVSAERAPAVIDEAAIGGGEALGCHHAGPVERGAPLVARAVQRRQHFAGNLPRLLQHRLQKVRRHLLETGQRDYAAHIGKFVDHELHVAYRRLIFRHRMSP